MKLFCDFYFGKYVQNHEFLTFDVIVRFEPDFHRSACFSVQVNQLQPQVRRSTFFCTIFAILVQVVIFLGKLLFCFGSRLKGLKHVKTVSKHIIMS